MPLPEIWGTYVNISTWLYNSPFGPWDLNFCKLWILIFCIFFYTYNWSLLVGEMLLFWKLLSLN